MGGISPEEAGLRRSVEVIVQYTKDGTIIPLRIKLEDEDGMTQVFNIKSYREIRAFSGKHDFEVKVNILNMERIIRLFFDGKQWFLR